jgi:hypothetical protein
MVSATDDSCRQSLVYDTIWLEREAAATLPLFSLLKYPEMEVVNSKSTELAFYSVIFIPQYHYRPLTCNLIFISTDAFRRRHALNIEAVRTLYSSDTVPLCS